MMISYRAGRGPGQGKTRKSWDWLTQRDDPAVVFLDRPVVDLLDD